MELAWIVLGVSSLCYKATAVTLLPETSSSHERAQNRLRDAIKAYTALLHNLPFMLYVLTGACAVGMLLAYITGSPFMYIEALGVTPELFAVLFGVNAVGFVSAVRALAP